MTIEERLTRCRVYVPHGVTINAAVAEHRDRTGHGGMCILVLPPPESKSRRRSKRNARAKG